LFHVQLCALLPTYMQGMCSQIEYGLEQSNIYMQGEKFTKGISSGQTQTDRADKNLGKSHSNGLTQTDRRGKTDPFPAQIWERVQSAHTSARAYSCPPLAHMAATPHRPMFSTAGTGQSAAVASASSTASSACIDAAPSCLRRPSMPDASMTALGGERPASLAYISQAWYAIATGLASYHDLTLALQQEDQERP
jgi:hypothetical protein